MKSIAITNVGSRSKNEDAFLEAEKLFVVCDGVGGSAYGEVASRLASNALAEFVHKNPVLESDAVYWNKALQFTVQKFQETERTYPETTGMSTTVVLTAFDEKGAIVAWLGDSRLYHLRNGKILFVTDDHSLKNEMAKDGKDVSQISRNFITKALSAKTNYGFSFHRITDVRQGDFFFLCTDGVLENVTDEILSREMALNTTLAEKSETIFSLCNGKTKDNFTFIILEI